MLDKNTQLIKRMQEDMENEQKREAYVYLPIDYPEEEKDQAMDDVLRDIEEYQKIAK